TAMDQAIVGRFLMFAANDGGDLFWVDAFFQEFGGNVLSLGDNELADLFVIGIAFKLERLGGSRSAVLYQIRGAVLVSVDILHQMGVRIMADVMQESGNPHLPFVY